MKGDAKVIEYLNKALRNELTAINQYFLHARMFDNWGFGKLGKHEYDESIDEMKHADRLVRRIWIWRGYPTCRIRQAFISVNTSRKCFGDRSNMTPTLYREAIGY